MSEREWDYFGFVRRVNASSLTSTQRDVLRQMAFAVDRRRPYLDDTPHETLAADLGINWRTVLRARQQLEELKVLRVVQDRPGWSTVYRLCPDRIPTRPPAEVRDRRRRWSDPEPLSQDQGSRVEPLSQDQGSIPEPLIHDQITPDRGSDTPPLPPETDPPQPPAPRGEPVGSVGLTREEVAAVRRAAEAQAEVAADRRRRRADEDRAAQERHEWLVAAMYRSLEGASDPSSAAEGYARAEQGHVDIWFIATRGSASRGRKLSQRLGLTWDTVEAIRAGIDQRRMPMPRPTGNQIAGALRDAAERWRALDRRPSGLDPPGHDPPPLDAFDDLEAILAR